jgi:hypothetical protein
LLLLLFLLLLVVLIFLDVLLVWLLQFWLLSLGHPSPAQGSDLFSSEFL